MQSIVIDINEADAYVALGDGTVANINISRLPKSTKAGQKLIINPALTNSINHRINQIII